MKNFHVTVMSIDPNDHSEDPHQKYGLTIEAKNDKEAIDKGVTQFKAEYRGLPIYSVKAFEK